MSAHSRRAAHIAVIAVIALLAIALTGCTAFAKGAQRMHDTLHGRSNERPAGYEEYETGNPDHAADGGHRENPEVAGSHVEEDDGE